MLKWFLQIPEEFTQGADINAEFWFDMHEVHAMKSN